VIDMGPEGGDGGGVVVAEGTPEQIAKSTASHTGRFLRDVLARRPATVQQSASARGAGATRRRQAAE
jgi:excinuclease ABC subunit A